MKNKIVILAVLAAALAAGASAFAATPFTFHPPANPTYADLCTSKTGWTADGTEAAITDFTAKGGVTITLPSAVFSHSVVYKTVSATNCQDKQFVIALKINTAAAPCDWSNLGRILAYFQSSSGNRRICELACLNEDLGGAGWCWFGGTTHANASYPDTGTPDLTAITVIGIDAWKQPTIVNGQQPSFVVGGFWVLPAAAAKAQILLRFDGAKATHYAAASALHDAGMKATFYVNQDVVDHANYLTTAQLLTMQGWGHVVACYTTNWLAIAVVDRPAYIQSVQAYLAGQGLTSGLRHMAIGGTGSVPQWSPADEAALIPAYLDTVSMWPERVGSARGLSRYMYAGRNDFSAATLAATEADLAAVVAARGRRGVLIHDLVGGNMTAFSTLVTYLAGLVTAGTAEVVDVVTAFNTDAAEGAAATFTLASAGDTPAGDDANPGFAFAPRQTFAAILPATYAGDTVKFNAFAFTGERIIAPRSLTLDGSGATLSGAAPDLFSDGPGRVLTVKDFGAQPARAWCGSALSGTNTNVLAFDGTPSAAAMTGCGN